LDGYASRSLKALNNGDLLVVIPKGEIQFFNSATAAAVSTTGKATKVNGIKFDLLFGRCCNK
jgi:hypothetical protein